MTVDPVFSLTVAWCLALLLGVAAAHKLTHWHDFRAALAGYALVANPLVSTAAGTLMVTESTLAVALVLGLPGAPIGAACLLTAYAAAMAASLLRGRRLADCGCGGRRQPPSWGLVARNLVLIAAALTLLLPEADRALGWLDGFTIAAGATVLALLYAAIDGLLADRARWLEEMV